MPTAVGIEALAIALPQHYIELADLARARGVDPDKYTKGLGGLRMAVPDPGEDAVALAATAARRLLATTRLDPGRIGLLAVGTESAVDHAKPIASHVQGLLGLPRAMRVYDVTHACYGGTAALQTACEWIASGAAAGRVALVICTDVARYGLETPGEPTQGAGAIALLVSAEPAVLALDLGVSGTSSQDVYDFWRPVGRREALVDGHYSIQCYLDTLAGAYRGWRAQARARGLIRGDLPSTGLARILYHVPFGKMAQKAHASLRQCDLVEVGQGNEQPSEDPDFKDSFARQVADSLWLCAEVGNVYTGSLYFSLAGLLDRQAEALLGQRIGLFSYGSGCCGEFYSGIVGQGAAGALRAARVGAMLAERRRLGIAEYERIMRLASDAPLSQSPRPGTFRLAEIRDHRRVYVAGPRAAWETWAVQPLLGPAAAC